MKNFGGLIWFVAYVIQMIALMAGVGLVVAISVSTLAEVLRRKVHRATVRKEPAKVGAFLTETHAKA